MRSRLIPALGAVVVLIAFVATSATGKPSPATKSANCTYDITTQGGAPGATSGKDLGYVKCGAPFGSGLQSDSFTDKVSGTSVKVSGPVKDYFDNGTVHGAYAISGKTTSTSFKGSASVTGGTGAYKHIKGVVNNLTCTPSSATQNHCTGKFVYSLG